MKDCDRKAGPYGCPQSFRPGAVALLTRNCVAVTFRIADTATGFGMKSMT